jgi:histidinol-phosphatase
MSTLSHAELSSLLDFAQDSSFNAGRLTLNYFQTQVAVERKADNSPVTVADKRAEAYLREVIGRAYPDHAIIGEEFPVKSTDSPFSWVIDPIDGTKSFIHGVPFYSNLLALLYHNEPIIGIAYFPALNEMVYAAKGMGCFFNGRRAKVSAVNALADATLLFSDVVGYGEMEPAWHTLIDSTYIQRTWGDSYGYALVATGRAEIMVDPAMNLWDSAPFGVIIPEAGGTFTDWSGVATVHTRSTIATNGALFDDVMHITKR